MINNRFIITTPVYNSEQWIRQCIQSVVDQTYKNWQMVVVDDMSTDKTLQVANEFSLHTNIKTLHNDTRKGALFNQIKCASTIPDCPNDIIINLDGDDWLANNNVFEFLNLLYQDSNIWMSYGEYKTLSGDPSQNNIINDTRNYRKHEQWCTSHLRTYRKKLWNKVNVSDLKGPDGNFFQTAPDLAMIFPIIEMCGKQRIKFVREILYVYNDANILNEFKANPSGLAASRDYIKSKNEYPQIQGSL